MSWPRLAVVAVCVNLAGAGALGAADVQAKIDQLNQREKQLIEKLDGLQQRQRYLQNQLEEVRRRKEFLLNQQGVRNLRTPEAPATP